MQSIKSSILESIVNTLSGFLIGWSMNILILPLFGFMVTGGQSFIIALIFTVIGFIRSYLVRRYFNNKVKREISNV